MRRKKRNTIKSDYRDTILIVVENSEVDFFNRYFKKFLKENYGISIRCESSGNRNSCEVLNFRKITKRINYALKDENYKAVFLLIDLKTNCRATNRNHTCLIELKKEYQPEYKIDIDVKDRFYLFVVCNEIESWFLTINPNKTDTNSVFEDHKQEIKRYLKVKTERAIVNRVLKGLLNEEFHLDTSKNISLNYFIKKLNNYNQIKV